ncbi:hypothetical protein MOV61_08080 [Neorhizobium sp. BETTINA12A]|uniref:hypothetical protein n=1 Tax=Neorhizobium sp. BETTINA12A TaxID=2908924 RepID=UPI001FF30BA0|nr:hypothetical protein [Neorhizobium sp. BETTINA12A]MCJ9750673.1 hypothetical protein [Neorhizobium sp. BETTINA12A]
MMKSISISPAVPFDTQEHANTASEAHAEDFVLHRPIEVLDERLQKACHRPSALGLRYLTIDDGDGQLVLGSGKRKARICFGMIEAPSLDNFTKKNRTGRLMVETLGKDANRLDRDSQEAERRRR